jgi:hypothetical protein
MEFKVSRGTTRYKFYDFPVVKRLLCEADHFVQSRVEAKNAVTATTPPYVFVVWCA